MPRSWFSLRLFLHRRRPRGIHDGHDGFWSSLLLLFHAFLLEEDSSAPLRGRKSALKSGCPEKVVYLKELKNRKAKHVSWPKTHPHLLTWKHSMSVSSLLGPLLAPFLTLIDCYSPNERPSPAGPWTIKGLDPYPRLPLGLFFFFGRPVGTYKSSGPKNAAPLHRALGLWPSSPKLKPARLLSSNIDLVVIVWAFLSPFLRSSKTTFKDRKSYSTPGWVPLHPAPSLRVFLHPEQVGMIIWKKLLDIPHFPKIGSRQSWPRCHTSFHLS